MVKRQKILLWVIGLLAYLGATTPGTMAQSTIKRAKPMQAATFNPNLMVADIRSSIRFYQTYLGFSIIQATPETGIPDWVMLQSGSSVLMLQAAPNIRVEYPLLAQRPFGGSLTFYVHVADVAALFEQMKAQVSIVRPLHKTPYGATEFAVADPDGFILTLAQDKP